MGAEQHRPRQGANKGINIMRVVLYRHYTIEQGTMDGKYWSGTTIQSLPFHSVCILSVSTDLPHLSSHTTPEQILPFSSWISTRSFTPFRFPFTITSTPPLCAYFRAKVDKCKAEDAGKRSSFFDQPYEQWPNPSYVYWTVHLCDSWRVNDQLDLTCYLISLLMCSTCFGH